jgi:methylated-DNA-[protein]-cysteine S-methyltransferase
LKVEHDERFIFRTEFVHPQQSEVPRRLDTELERLISQELDAYQKNPKHVFTLPLEPHGTAFQKSVWNALSDIPSGETLSYGELALELKSAPRAIGQACKRNPIAVFIPCHRVVGKESLGGYMGVAKGIAYKTSLLTHEGLLFESEMLSIA